jgi:redox-sensitive bicupin YhaK (pirin superfamily)
MTEPSYGDIKSENVPVINESGTKVHVLAGDYLGHKGAFEGKYIKATYLDVELHANQEWHFINDAENTLFVYIFTGKAIFDPDKSIDNPKDLVDEKQAVLFSHDDKFWIKAADQGVRFILLSAKPLKEPIAWGGPIVMNTKEELNSAFRELDNNTFIKIR